MLKRNNFFKDDFKNLKNYKKNKTKTKKVFKWNIGYKQTH